MRQHAPRADMLERLLRDRVSQPREGQGRLRPVGRHGHGHQLLTASPPTLTDHAIRNAPQPRTWVVFGIQDHFSAEADRLSVVFEGGRSGLGDVRVLSTQSRPCAGGRGKVQSARTPLCPGARSSHTDLVRFYSSASSIRPKGGDSRSPENRTTTLWVTSVGGELSTKIAWAPRPSPVSHFDT